MTFDARNGSAHEGAASSPVASQQPAPGRQTLTSALPPVQRTAAETLSSAGSSVAVLSSSADASSFDPFAIHALDDLGPVQLKEAGAVDRSATRAAADADAPREDSIEETRSTLPMDGGHQLSTAQLARAHRRNGHYWRTLGFHADAFCADPVESDEFALAVAAFQREAGLHVDGIAGPETCRAKSVPMQRPSGAAPHDEAADDPSLESTRGARNAQGANDRAAGDLVDRADSLDTNRDTLPVQTKTEGQRQTSAAATQQIAAQGVQGPGQPLPHLDTIQRSFGDAGEALTDVRAHVGGAAQDAAGRIGAVAYATGDDVALPSSPDVRLVAHEAAHVVQQRGGVNLKGGVGEAGDPYERQADAVADRVAAGESAADLLGTGHGASGSVTGAAVQRYGSPEHQSMGNDVHSVLDPVLAAAEDPTNGQCTPEGDDPINGESRIPTLGGCRPRR